MKPARALLAAFVAAVPTTVVALARRASRKTGKSILVSLRDVPAEAQRLASDVKFRATETVSDVRTRSTEAVSTSLQTIREKEAAIKERIVGEGHEQEAAPEVAEAEAAEAGEAEEQV